MPVLENVQQEINFNSFEIGREDGPTTSITWAWNDMISCTDHKVYPMFAYDML